MEKERENEDDYDLEDGDYDWTMAKQDVAL
jgi:hypothetical protein